tara:strand:+ start:192 stop:401 length:210 start_codon:yes stop_codon:yes gene_type:complete
MKKITIIFGDKLLQIDANQTLEDFLRSESVDTRNIATSVNSDLILRHERKDKILKEKDRVNIFGPITGG